MGACAECRSGAANFVHGLSYHRDTAHSGRPTSTDTADSSCDVRRGNCTAGTSSIVLPSDIPTAQPNREREWDC